MPAIDDQISAELVSSLREWHREWRQLYLRRETARFDAIRSAMVELMDWREQLRSGACPPDLAARLRAQIAAKIDWGNADLGLDFVPRSPATHAPVEPDSMSAIELLDLHYAQTNSTKTAANAVANDSPKPPARRHILVTIRDTSLNNNNGDEQMQIDLALHDGQDFLTEKFCYRSGAKVNTVMFADLPAKYVSPAIAPQLQLAVQIWRFGKMLVNEGRKGSQGSGHFKRAFAFNLVSLSELSARDTDHTIRLYDGDLHTSADILARKQTNKLTHAQNASLSLAVRLLTDEQSSVVAESPNACVALVRGFGDIIAPTHVRNDLYLLVESGEFEKGGKAIPKNIEATACLVTENGVHETAISSGANDERQTYYRSHVIYHQNSPKWGEQMKIHVPLDLFEGAHIRLEFRHCSSKERDRKLIGFSFLPLADNLGACIADGEHELYIYKCDDNRKLDDVNNYIFIPWGPKDSVSLANSSYYFRSPKEFCHIKTVLVSSKLTQNSDLLSLLKWRTNPEQVIDAIKRVMRIPGDELVKFLEDVLDALFALFATNDGTTNAHTGLVFKVLVHIFTTLGEPRFVSYGHALDRYVESQFSAALVHRGLISCVKQCADLVAAPDKREPILKCMRVLAWLVRFIIQSRLLYTRATGHCDDSDSFRAELFSLYGALNRVLSLESAEDIILSIQEAILDSVPVTFPQLIPALGILNVAKLVKTVVNSTVVDTSRKIISAKLEVIHETVKSEPIWSCEESRSELLDTIIRQLVLHIAEKETLPILRRIIIHLRQTGSRRDTEMLSIGALDVMVEHIIELSDDTVVGDPEDHHNPDVVYLSGFVTCFISLLERMNETDFVQLFEIRSHRQRKELLCHIFGAFRAALSHFPDSWMTMKMSVNHIILCSLQELCSIMSRDFLAANFDIAVWRSFFSLAIGFLTQRRLQLETLSPMKQTAITERYGDMRVLMGFQLVACWEQLGGSKIEFIPSLVSPFLEVTLVPETDLRKATIPIFYDMIDVEYASAGNFKQVECALIDKMDLLINSGAGDIEFRQLLTALEKIKQHLNDKITSMNPIWRDDGYRFIGSLSKLLSLLLDYRQVMDSDGDRALMCTYALLRFYRDEIQSPNRQSITLRYIHKLSSLHVPLGHFAEAAFTLQLHANQLDWDTPSEYAEKEQLYQTIIDYFDRGSCWEAGVKMCKELESVYERSFAIEKLSAALKTRAKFLDNILTKLRPENEYFRVGFYGLDFPSFLQNRVFVYRGLELEKIGAFTQRIQSEFIGAQIMTKNVPPDDNITESHAQYIQIVAVKPVAEPPAPSCEPNQMPDTALAYFNTNCVRKFIYDRPVQRAPFDPNNEFKSLWIERTHCSIEHQLPNVLRVFEVVATQVSQVSPIEHACETVDNMNAELSKLIAAFADGKLDSVSPLSMRLQGVLEAAVNGGVAKYIDAFLSPSSVGGNGFVGRLKAGLAQQIRILEDGLALHGRLAPAAVRPLHTRLVERFATMRAHIHHTNHDTRPAILSQPLPPIPIDKKLALIADSPPVYGHLIEDGIYSVPADNPNPSRPRSAGFENGNGGARVQRSRSIPRSCHPSASPTANSCSTGPPLPPRSSTLERNNGHSPAAGERPALPKRVRKCSNDLEYKLIDIDIDARPSAQSSSPSAAAAAVQQFLARQRLDSTLDDHKTNASLLD